ncbi:MAG: allantoicase [Actinobacteria bacterium 13_2_20CM_2_71_6]|nr:MAG: allantoicase [Actinobacteria bacterium 13_2_20CM_2_71_6]
MNEFPDLASRILGGGVVYATDEFFAAADNLVNPGPPSFTPRTFGAKGQVYDGWETRRRREPGYDEAIVRLGAPGVVHGVVVDTAHFTGNYPPYASVEGCGVEGYPSPAELRDADWIPLIPRSPLLGDARNVFPVTVDRRLTHVRLSIYPDGGVARLRVPGEVVPDPRLLVGGLVDLAALEHGGAVVGCSDMFYGAPDNLILPGPARVMGDGWETARRRDGGNDWVVVRLAAPGRVRLAEVDTSHFKGNAPGTVTLRGADARTGPLDDGAWFPLLPGAGSPDARIRVQPDTRHRFPVADAPVATHVRLDVFPDGGLARLRLPGEIAAEDLAALGRRWWGLLPPQHAKGVPPEDALRYAADLD